MVLYEAYNELEHLGHVLADAHEKVTMDSIALQRFQFDRYTHLDSRTIVLLNKLAFIPISITSQAFHNFHSKLDTRLFNYSHPDLSCLPPCLSRLSFGNTSASFSPYSPHDNRV